MEEILVTVNGTNITPYINRKTYKMNQEDIYESWENANMIESRILIRTRIKGSFEVSVYGRNDMDYEAFLSLWNSAVDNGVVTIGVYVQNTNEFEAIEAYYKTSGVAHNRLMGGSYFDRVTFEIEER